ncbi:tyrosine-type recombinase/integrase [Peptoclostridium acidaminophilum]|nr:tyrosine-type recombinase/integrase [Peptoclostridium acidaminophilum]
MREVSNEGRELINSFISSLSEKNLNSKTIQEYSADLKHFIGWHEYQGMDTCQNMLIFSFDQICVRELETYKEAMQNLKLKPSTINRRISTLKLFFDWAYHCGLSVRNPAKHVRLNPVQKGKPREITQDEEKRLLDTVKSHGTLRDQAMLKLMIHTGIRVGEACSLMISDISVSKKSGSISIVSGSQTRKIPLNYACASALERYVSSLKIAGDGPLFRSEKTGEKLTERAVRYIVRKYMVLAGLEGLSAYSFRHSFGYKKAQSTSLHKLADIMGHSNLSTTMSYVKASDEESKGNE